MNGENKKSEIISKSFNPYDSGNDPRVIVQFNQINYFKKLFGTAKCSAGQTVIIKKHGETTNKLIGGDQKVYLTLKEN